LCPRVPSCEQFAAIQPLLSLVPHSKRIQREEENHSQNSPSALENSKELQKNLDTHGDTKKIAVNTDLLGASWSRR
jgi:hypothetical protein